MPAPFTAGQSVRHPDFGEGTVRSLSANGALVRVYFVAIGDVEIVNASSLVRLAGPVRLAEPPPAPVPPGPQAASHLDRLTVECLRQGLPPPGRLTSWTVGHAKARSAIDAAIASAASKGKGSVLFARAAYGQGKSHLGRLGRELAREQGLASLHVELDGAGLSLGTGSRVVAALFSSAQLPDTGRDQEHQIPGLATLLRRAAGPARNSLPRELEYFAPFLDDPTPWADSEEVIEVLEEYLSGFRNRTDASAELQRLLGMKVPLESLKMDWGRVEDRRRSQAEQLERVVRLAMLTGAKGAFVVIDELDHDFRDDGDVERKEAMLGELARVAHRCPMVLMLLARELEIQNAQELELGDFRKEELEQLVGKAIDAFGTTYPSPAMQIGRKELFAAMMRRFREEYQERGWGPRFFVRAAVECCEAARSSGFGSLADVQI